jgi:hypothetical protein
LATVSMIAGTVTWGHDGRIEHLPAARSGESIVIGSS